MANGQKPKRIRTSTGDQVLLPGASEPLNFSFAVQEQFPEIKKSVEAIQEVQPDKGGALAPIRGAVKSILTDPPDVALKKGIRALTPTSAAERRQPIQARKGLLDQLQLTGQDLGAGIRATQPSQAEALIQAAGVDPTAQGPQQPQITDPGQLIFPEDQAQPGTSGRRQQLQDTLARFRQSVLATEGLKASAAEQQADLISQTNENLRVQEEADRIARDEDDRVRTVEIDRLAKTRDAFANQPDIDPERFFKSRTTGQKIAAALAIGLGSGISSGQNPGLSIINNAIENDIRAQEQNINKRGVEFGQQQQLLGAMERQFGDREKARAATKIMMLDNAKRDLEAAALRSNAGIIRQTAQSMGAQMDLEIQRQIDAFDARTAQAQAFRRLGQGGLSGIDAATLARLPEKEQKDIRERLTSVGLARTKEDAKKIKEAVEKLGPVRDLIREAQQFRKERGARIIPFTGGITKEGKKGTTLGGQLTLMGKELFELGVLSKDDIALLGDVIPKDLGDIGQVQLQLKLIEQFVNNKLKTFIQERTIRGGTGPAPRFTPQGQ